MKKISAEIIADSKDRQGNRLTSYILTYPRMIHAEVMTHRMFSRNAASSRAIPFKKMVKSIKEDPFIPIAWQKDHNGMQGNLYIQKAFSENCKNTVEDVEAQWLEARDAAVYHAEMLNSVDGVTKQLCNRLLETFQWYTCLVSATEFDNFFELRCPKYTFVVEDDEFVFKSKKDAINHFGEDAVVVPGLDVPLKDLTTLQWLDVSKSGAEIHIQALAEAMWDARWASKPKQLKEGEWHIPFGDNMSREDIVRELIPDARAIASSPDDPALDYYVEQNKVIIATARCARLSYMTFDGKIDYAKDLELYKMLAESKHASPFEHVAQVMTNDEYYEKYVNGQVIYKEDGETVEDVDTQYLGWCGNFKGFIQARYLLGLE